MTLRLRKLSYEVPPEIADERSRLEDLYALRIIDTASERRFDQYTELLTIIFKAPIALISFVDKERLWFKSVRGLAITETPRETSFCAHAIAGGPLLVVPDALVDPRFAEHPAVVGGPKLRFYAGCVIRGPKSQPIGTCSVIDRVPRALLDHEEAALRKVTRMVEQELAMNVETAHLKRTLQDAVLLDSSTGLPNLTLFSERLKNVVSVAKREAESFVLALARVDRFDALEAAVGREPASYLVRKLVERMEDIDAAPSFIGQVREDKLGLIIPLHEGAAPEAALESLLRCVEEPFALDDHAVPLRISVGASVYPRDATTMQTLLKRARTALWSKPVSEHSEYRLYRRGHSNAAMRHFRLESALKRALERDEFHLVYQPKVTLQGQALVGAEALLRWTSADLGNVPPSRFIPVAEASGLIGELGDWVLSAACSELAGWRARHDCPEVAVNITSGQLRKTDFVESLDCLLRYHGLAPGQLNLELTESSLVEDMEGAVRIMRRLCKIGATFSIDDFGTGFSSLSYLRRMPIKTLKIDRSFIKNLATQADDAKLVRSIVYMGHSLGLQVVAEGVETQAQLELLRGFGCDQVQGYLVSRPLTASQFEEYMNRRTPVREPPTRR